MDDQEYLSPGYTDTSLVETTMGVASWNIWWRFGGWRQRAPLIRDALASSGADAICLQEVWDDETDNQAALLAGDLGFHFAYESVLKIDGIHWGMAVLSRWPISSSDGVVLPSMPSDDGSRDCKAMWARIEGPRGGIDAFCTHLSWRPEESAIRQRQVAAIAEYVSAKKSGPMPPIVCGDFNALPTADEIRMMTGEATCPVEGQFFFDAWRMANPADPGFTWSRNNPLTAPALQQDRRLDYVFVGETASNGAGHVQSAEMIGDKEHEGSYPSDHFGVAVTLRY